jgi:hypothetical protein
MRIRPITLLLFAVLAVPAYWVGSSYWQAHRFYVDEREAQERYKSEYQQWLKSDPSTLVQALIRVRGEPFSRRTPRASVALATIPAVEDPMLQSLLTTPDVLAKLDLFSPRSLAPNVDVHELLGKWRFSENDDAMRTEAIVPTSTKDGRQSFGPLVPSSALADALVLREGTSAGDWLFHLPRSATCPLLYLRDGGEYCATSLRSWLAASVVGAESGWSRFDAEEEQILKELRVLEKVTLATAVADVVSFDPGPWSAAPKIEDKRRASASQDWAEVVDQLATARPPAVLTIEQTYSAESAYSQYTAQVRLWDGERMRSIRLRPQDFEGAVVVLAEPYGGQRVVELQGQEGVVYVDLHTRRAFRNFSGWVDWARAAERAWRWQGQTTPPNAARFPIG